MSSTNTRKQPPRLAQFIEDETRRAASSNFSPLVGAWSIFSRIDISLWPCSLRRAVRVFPASEMLASISSTPYIVRTGLSFARISSGAGFLKGQGHLRERVHCQISHLRKSGNSGWSLRCRSSLLQLVSSKPNAISITPPCLGINSHLP